MWYYTISPFVGMIYTANFGWSCIFVIVIVIVGNLNYCSWNQQHIYDICTSQWSIENTIVQYRIMFLTDHALNINTSLSNLSILVYISFKFVISLNWKSQFISIDWSETLQEAMRTRFFFILRAVRWHNDDGNSDDDEDNDDDDSNDDDNGENDIDKKLQTTQKIKSRSFQLRLALELGQGQLKTGVSKVSFSFFYPYPRW